MLRGVKLKAKMGKIRGKPGECSGKIEKEKKNKRAGWSENLQAPASFGFELSAYFTVKDVRIMVTGSIPRLQEGKPVEFTLSLAAIGLAESMDIKGLLELCADTQVEMKNCEILDGEATYHLLY